MRPTLFYAVFENGVIHNIVQGVAEAKKIGPGYKGFKKRTDAEEFAMWWNYENPRWGKPTMSIRERILGTPRHKAL